MLDRVVSVASRPGRCPHATCVGSRLRLLSAEGQRLAPAGSTYGYDVVVRLGSARGRAPNLVHPRTLQWLDVAQWLAPPTGSAHVRSLSGTTQAPRVAYPGRAQRQTNGLGPGSGDGLAQQLPSVLSGPLSAQPGRTPRRG